MPQLPSISVERRSGFLLIAAAVLFIAALGMLVLASPPRHLLIDALSLVLTVGALSLLLLTGLLEQRRRYVNRIGRLDRAHKAEISAVREEMKTLASQVERAHSHGQRNDLLHSAHSARLAENELRVLRKISLLTDAISTPKDLFTSGEALRLATALIDDDPLRSFELLSEPDSFDDLPISPRRRLAINLRSMGYLSKSLRVLESVVRSTQNDRDKRALRNRRCELEILQGKYRPKLQAATGIVRVVPGHVLHVVGKSLPATRSQYTLRTHYSARAQLKAGLKVAVVSQMGESVDNTSARVDVVDGVAYHSVPGEGRTAGTLEEWLDGNVAGVSAVVKQERPAVLHAHSDFFNALTAEIVGEHYGIPVVYETWGSWEESWLSRVSQEHGVEAWNRLTHRWGMPDTYVLRTEREREAREKSDHVFVSGREMQSNIEEQGSQSSRISLVPNAGSVDDSPVLNAEVHMAVYRSLGALTTPETPSLPDISEECYGETVQWLSAKTPTNYVHWFGRLANLKPIDIIEDGWTYADFPPVPLDLPINWSGLCVSNRTWAFKLHTWEFMDPLVREYLATGNRESLNWCVERALSWLRNYVWMDARVTQGDDMAWYDMALGLRSPRLLALIDFAVKEGLGADIVRILLEGALRHAHEHAKEESFNPRTNHGYYAAVGQIALSSGLRTLPGMPELEDQGERRLSQMASTQFLEDGIHSEHSPDYHRMLLNSFQVAIANGLIKSRRTIDWIERAEYALGWMIKPDGGLVQFGDSPERIVTAGRISECNNPHTQFLRSVGRFGSPDESTLAVFPSGGYAFVRDPQPKSTDDHRSASYLAFAAAFHSRTHKHADDLNLIWSDHGKEILVDSGRYGYGELLPTDSPLRMEGYYYGSPERQYVESTVAHNTVAADGRNHDRRNRKPYGSALGNCYRSGATYVLTGSVDHGIWSHHREVRFTPGTSLVIQDDLISLDNGRHDFLAWFNLAGDLDVDRRAGLTRVASAEWRVPLWITSTAGDFDVEPVRGQRDPLRGWRSLQDRSLTETWSLAYGLSGSLGGTITTVFNFGEEPLTGA